MPVPARLSKTCPSIIKPMAHLNTKSTSVSKSIRSQFATCRIALSRVALVTAVLVISLLTALPEVSRAQLPCNSNCHYLTIVETGGVGINCVGCQTLDSCNALPCSDSIDAFYITLDAAANCCIDSIGVTPPMGVCWKGCMATLASGGGYNIWQYGDGAGPSCTNLSCDILGAPLYQLCHGETIYCNFCATGGTLTGFSFKFYWHDGSTCTKIAP